MNKSLSSLDFNKMADKLRRDCRASHSMPIRFFPPCFCVHPEIDDEGICVKCYGLPVDKGIE